MHFWVRKWLGCEPQPNMNTRNHVAESSRLRHHSEASLTQRSLTPDNFDATGNIYSDKVHGLDGTRCFTKTNSTLLITQHCQGMRYLKLYLKNIDFYLWFSDNKQKKQIKPHHRTKGLNAQKIFQSSRDKIKYIKHRNLLHEKWIIYFEYSDNPLCFVNETICTYNIHLTFHKRLLVPVSLLPNCCKMNDTA
jgi:hypothetical protein